MKAKLIVTATTLCLTSVVYAENLKEKFEHAQQQQAEYVHETKWIPAYEQVVKAGMRSQGFTTSARSLRYSTESTFSYIADTQAVCMTENLYLVELTNRFFSGQSLNSDFAQEAFSQHMFCVNLPDTIGTAKQDFQYGSELRDQHNFIRNVRLAIQSTGFDSNEFSIPSDYMSRMAVMPSLGGFAIPLGGKDGLYVESTTAVCKIQTGMRELQAECVRKSQ